MLQIQSIMYFTIVAMFCWSTLVEVFARNVLQFLPVRSDRYLLLSLLISGLLIILFNPISSATKNISIDQ